MKSNLSNIITTINNYIVSVPAFKEINTEVEVMELKEYDSIVFMKICDDDKQTIMKSVIFKSAYTTKIEPGNKLKIKSSVRLYKTEIELVIKSYSVLGNGANMTSLAKLKSQLDGLGYFDAANKKEIMSNYQTIGIVSSLNAAGMKDFIHTINSRCSCKNIYVYPATVQGSAGPAELQKAIQLANKHNIVQVLAIIRGGGSKDDLECFNDTNLAKVIFESVLPIVTGIGHQIDTSIADLVADKNFITPTAVAQSITTENVLTVEKINLLISNLKDLFNNKFNSYYDWISNTESKLRKYKLQHMEKISAIIKLHSASCADVKRHLRLATDLQYKYLSIAENDIVASKENIFKQSGIVISAYINGLHILESNIREKIFNYDATLKKISKPKIICKATNEEVYNLKNFKKNQKYLIQFIDGSYNIKIKKRT